MAPYIGLSKLLAKNEKQDRSGESIEVLGKLCELLYEKKEMKKWISTNLKIIDIAMTLKQYSKCIDRYLVLLNSLPEDTPDEKRLVS